MPFPACLRWDCYYFLVLGLMLSFPYSQVFVLILICDTNYAGLLAFQLTMKILEYINLKLYESISDHKYYNPTSTYPSSIYNLSIIIIYYHSQQSLFLLLFLWRTLTKIFSSVFMKISAFSAFL